jgi:hypothetical protein
MRAHGAERIGEMQYEDPHPFFLSFFLPPESFLMLIV